MLVIRDAQFDALRRSRADAFERRVEAGVRACSAEWRDATPDAVRALVTTALARAARYAIFQPDDVERFTLYVARYGVDFGDTPDTAWARSILRDRTRLGGQKLDALDAHGRSLLDGSR